MRSALTDCLISIRFLKNTKVVRPASIGENPMAQTRFYVLFPSDRACGKSWHHDGEYFCVEKQQSKSDSLLNSRGNLQSVRLSARRCFGVQKIKKNCTTSHSSNFCYFHQNPNSHILSHLHGSSPGYISSILHVRFWYTCFR